MSTPIQSTEDADLVPERLVRIALIFLPDDVKACLLEKCSVGAGTQFSVLCSLKGFKRADSP